MNDAARIAARIGSECVTVGGENAYEFDLLGAQRIIKEEFAAFHTRIATLEEANERLRSALEYIARTIPESHMLFSITEPERYKTFCEVSHWLDVDCPATIKEALALQPSSLEKGSMKE